MVWFLISLGIFLAFAAAMYVPDWIRWAKWNSRRKKMPEGKRRGLRPPVSPPFWSAYAGPVTVDNSGPGGGCDGGFGGAGGGDGGGGGAGGCD